MTIKIGDTIPTLDLFIMGEGGGPEAISTDALFKDKTVALFGLPGAFTPTCSASHLPGYVQHADALREKGIDDIICLSVNDAFVMDAWGKSQNVGDKVMMLADGSAAFTKAIGMELDLIEAGLGVRSNRYSMVVENGVVTHLNDEGGGGFEVSSAEDLLAQL